LLLAVAAESPAVVVQSVLAGKAPPVKIEGDVQLAAELGWLADNLRWDVEEDLSRIIGDVPAHTLAGFARQAIAGLRQFLAQAPLASSSGAVTVPPVTEPPKASS
jgi:ubiquinone biosynthesis protein UbiJ